MRKEIKKSYIVFDIVLSLTLIVLLVNFFVIKNTKLLFTGSISAGAFLLLALIFGYERRKKRFTQETLFYVFFYTVIYVLLTYIIGIVSGFNYSIYSFSFNSIIHNVVPFLLYIISCELLRSQVTRKCEKSFLAYALITFIMVVIDCTYYLTTFDISVGDGQVKFICCILLPSVAKNLYLLYVSIIGGFYPSLLYRIIMEVKTFIIPIIPDFGLYFDSILDTMMPAIFGLIIYVSLKQYQNKEVEGKNYRQSKLFTYSSIIVTCLIIVLIVSLTSCKFKYGALSIGSGSMTGVINKGDVVVYKTLGKRKPEVGDIIVFKKDGKRIVHRVIDVVDVDEDERVYYTKGDANKSPDGYPLFKKDLIGMVQFRIPYIGVPSVFIYETITHKR